MAALSDYLENALINATLRNTAYTSPTTVYLALATASFADANTGGGELSGGGYARQPITFVAPTNGATENSADVTFSNLQGVSSTPVSHFGIFDAASGGNLLYHGALTQAQTVPDGEQAIVRAGALDVTLA